MCLKVVVQDVPSVVPVVWFDRGYGGVTLSPGQHDSEWFNLQGNSRPHDTDAHTVCLARGPAFEMSKARSLESTKHTNMHTC